MTDIPKAAVERAEELAQRERHIKPIPSTWRLYKTALARYIAEVSEVARSADEFIGQRFTDNSIIRERLQALILPSEEDELLKEARQLAVDDGSWSDGYRQQLLSGELDRTPAVRHTLAGLKRGIEIGEAK